MGGRAGAEALPPAEADGSKPGSASARWRKTRQALRFASSQLGVVGRRLEEAPEVDASTKRVLDKVMMAHRSASFAERQKQKALASGKKPRRTKGQWDILNAAFLNNPKPEEAELIKLGEEVGITLKQVRTFFQNKRQRHRFSTIDDTNDDARVGIAHARTAVAALQEANALLSKDNIEVKMQVSKAEADLEALVEASNDMVSDLMIYGRITRDHLEALWGAGLQQQRPATAAPAAAVAAQALSPTEASILGMPTEAGAARRL